LNTTFIEHHANILFRQKFYKLKKESESLLAANGTAPTTPAVNKAKTTTSSGKSGSGTGKRARKPKDTEAADAGDDDAGETPSKKVKTEKDGAGVGKKVKKEAIEADAGENGKSSPRLTASNTNIFGQMPTVRPPTARLLERMSWPARLRLQLPISLLLPLLRLPLLLALMHLLLARRRRPRRLPVRRLPRHQSPRLQLPSLLVRLRQRARRPLRSQLLPRLPPMVKPMQTTRLARALLSSVRLLPLPPLVLRRPLLKHDSL
jgi:hypothetical protein